MADDSITETVGLSWFSRIVAACKGLVAGLIIIPVAGVLLFWNEGRSVTHYRLLNEARRLVNPLPGTNLQAKYEGKLVYLTGPVCPGQNLVDQELGIWAEALKLQRVTELYQWEEESESKEKKKLGGGKSVTKTYTYHQVWRNELISSRQFNQPKGHENPEAMPLESETFTANPVSLGDFVLGEALVAKIDQYTPLPLSSTAGLPDRWKDALQLYQGAFYRSPKPASPQIGDLRISYRAVPPGPFSAVAKQAAKKLDVFQLPSRGQIALIMPGILSPDALFKIAHQSNRMWTWILRGAGFIAMFIGLKLLAGPLEIVADFVPAIGNLAGNLSFLLSLLLAAIISLLIISVAWIIYRPLWGAGLLVGAIAVAILMRRMKAGSSKAAKINP